VTLAMPRETEVAFDVPHALALVAECRRMATVVPSRDLGWLLALAERAITDLADRRPPGSGPTPA
jgi:hypothetical protein